MKMIECARRRCLKSARRDITHVHAADSNRLAAGWGHMPFEEVFQILDDIGYDGYLTAEILPKPDPDSAARQAARYLLPRFGQAAPQSAALHGRRP